MLDLAHPQTRSVFEASAIQERIRPRLLGWLDGNELSGPVRAEILDCWLPELHALNWGHFGNRPGITRTLDTLAAAVRGTDAQVAWSCFLALAEHPGDNFGTWMI
ncbi:hypothetical protein [Deinococcus sp. UYEF24]